MTREQLETPVSYTHAVTKARRILGAIPGKRLVEMGVVTQDAEHDGGNGKWYVFPHAPEIVTALASPADPANVELSAERAALDAPTEIAADAATPREDSRTSTKETTVAQSTSNTRTASSRSRAAAPQATPTPAENMEQAAAKLDVQALTAELKKRIKAAVRGVSFKDAPSGAYSTVLVAKKPIAYLNPRGKAVVVHLGITERPDDVTKLTLEQYASPRPRFALQTKVTSEEQADDLLKCIEAAAVLVAK